MAKIEPAANYEQLKAQAEADWKVKQTIAAQNLADMMNTLMKMPDVVDAPSPDVEWSHPDLACPVDAGKYFLVTRWVTVNGLRHRAELRCSSCGHLDTWDWHDRVWLDS